MKFKYGTAALLLLANTGFAFTPSIEGCAQTTTVFSNTPGAPIAIPDNDTTGITSAISVSGITGTIHDIDVILNVPHTFSADLDISLTSPTGTTVTLTTDNSGGNDNVFAGTIFDDQATILGGLTSTNFGVVDTTYTNLVTKTILTPEEPLAALINESPIGDWTLRLLDDTATDTGTLNSWSVVVTTCAVQPARTTTSLSASPAAAITDDNTLNTFTQTVSGVGNSLCNLRLTTDIAHTFPADLDVTLTSPAGTRVKVTTDNGVGNDNIFAGTVWDNDADPTSTLPYSSGANIATDHVYANLTLASTLTPEESFAAFFGENPNGTWTLGITDDTSPDPGTLNSWTIEVTTCEKDTDNDGVGDSGDDCSGVADTDTNGDGIGDCIQGDYRPVSLSAIRKPGNKLQCSFKVKNNGAVASQATTAQVRHGASADSIGRTKETIAIPSLAAGATSAKFTSTKKKAAGQNYCIINVDATDLIVETNEDNNRASKKQR